MPELPEVETVMMGLKPALEGHRFVHVETRRRDLRIPFPNDFAGRLTGKRVTRMWRRAKYIMADLDDGETLVIHLGMSGSMSVYATGAEPQAGAFHYERVPDGAGTGKHDHVVFDNRRAGARCFQRPSPLRADDADRNRFRRRAQAVQGTSASSPCRADSTPRSSPRHSKARRRRSNPLCSTSASSQGSATSMSARRCGGRAFRPSAAPRG